MSRRFLELAVRARRFVTPTSHHPVRDGVLPTTRRQVPRELTHFSFRLAFMIDVACMGLGALGGAAFGRATSPSTDAPPVACSAALRVVAGFRRAE